MLSIYLMSIRPSPPIPRCLVKRLSASCGRGGYFLGYRSFFFVISLLRSLYHFSSCSTDLLCLGTGIFFALVMVTVSWAYVGFACSLLRDPCILVQLVLVSRTSVSFSLSILRCPWRFCSILCELAVSWDTRPYFSRSSYFSRRSIRAILCDLVHFLTSARSAAQFSGIPANVVQFRSLVRVPRVASYFTTLSYEVGGEVFSMADLEHCVLRAKTSQPKQVGGLLPASLALACLGLFCLVFCLVSFSVLSCLALPCRALA